MFTFKGYMPPNKEVWNGRSDGGGSLRFHEAIKCIDITTDWSLPHSDSAFGLLGFASDEGIKRNKGRLGARDGPSALRRCLAPLAYPSFENHTHIYDFGDIACLDSDLEASQIALSKAVHQLLQRNITPLLIGGGHEIAWAHYLGIRTAHPHKKIGIFNFDAHFDMREPLNTQSTSGSSFLQILRHDKEHQSPVSYSCLGIQSSSNTNLLFQTAKEWNASYITADEFHLCGIEPALNMIDDLLQHIEIAYVSICMDVFAAPFAPGVSAPQPLGLLPWHVLAPLQRLVSSGKTVAIDIAELSPPNDISNTTAQLAAQLLYHALNKFKPGS